MTPSEIEVLSSKVLKAISPLREADKNSSAPANLLFMMRETKASRQLPKHYLLYFLLIDLLKFKNLGRFEKIAWSVPIDFNGKAFVIEYRKMGVGIFVENPDLYEEDTKRIVSLIKKGIKIAQPYFEWLASESVEESKLNVTNKGYVLFQKFEYFLTLYKEKAEEASKREKEFYIASINDEGRARSYYFPSWDLKRNAEWLALASIDSFFTWTEHIFIHIAILLGKISTGVEVAKLAEAEWSVKFKNALRIDDRKTKNFFDQLILIRRQLRNYLAHGAFGKDGRAFEFHSKAGAVPVCLPHQAGRNRFVIADDLGFDEAAAINVIENFINYLWSEERAPAKIYIQESDLPLILTKVQDGSYSKAMQSVQDMKEFVERLSWRWTRSANMDG